MTRKKKDDLILKFLRKTAVLLAVVLMISISISGRCQAEEVEEWEESGTVLLDKVTYDTRTRKMTVEITETSGSIAHEYELYILTELEISSPIGQFMNLGRLLNILGIMTVDVNDPDRITLKGNGVIVISDQEIYFGENEEAKAGMKVYVGVESLDENYNSSKSNLIELTLTDGLNEQGAINTQGNNDSGNDTPAGNGQTGQSGSSGNSLMFILIGIGALLAGGVAFFFSKKKDTPTKSTNKNEKSDNEKDNFEPSFEDKSVVVCSKSEQLVNALKDRHYLSVNQCEAEDVDDAIIENKPDILISDVNSEEELNELLAKKKAFEEDKEKPDFALGLHVNDELLPSIKERLTNLEADKQICGFAPYSASAYDVLVRLILPILKPDLKSDASLENLGKIADLLGIPGVSSVVGAFIAGRDIKSNLEEGELGVSEGAAIIGDIASILGFDKVAEVAGLVDDVDSIRSAFDSQAGANEAKNGALGAKDIVDVVKDLTDKG